MRFRMKRRMLAVPAAVLALVATLIAAPSPAEARCSIQTMGKLVDRVKSAFDDVPSAPALARLELQDVRQDIASCSATGGTNLQQWGLLLLNEMAKLGQSASTVNEGHFSRGRDEIRAERRLLARYRAQARGDKKVLSMLDDLTKVATWLDDIAHNGQRVTSMKVAGDHAYDAPAGPRTNPLRPSAAAPRLNATPSSFPAPACAHPTVPATVLRAAEPDSPPLAQQQGINGTVQVVVSLDADSHVIATRIQSSPSSILNASALTAARNSTYQTEIRDCKPIPSEMIYPVDFISQ
jgi:hypothetical protein